MLAAEVVSPSSVKRDYETKREEYPAYGLLEYWIVDPLKRQVVLLTGRGDTWDEVVLGDQDVMTSLVLPGFATTVAELWIDVHDEDDDSADAASIGS
jgi:Uma2 family endonuclease